MLPPAQVFPSDKGANEHKIVQKAKSQRPGLFARRGFATGNPLEEGGICLLCCVLYRMGPTSTWFLASRPSVSQARCEQGSSAERAPKKQAFHNPSAVEDELE